MNLSPDARKMTGLTLLTVPTIVWGGLTVLSVITQGAHGMMLAPLELSPAQQTLYRAGHAHAGALVILSLVIQVLLDSATLSSATRWLARLTAPAAAVLMSAGFFGLAHAPALAGLLWAGAAALVTTVLITGVGLMRVPERAAAQAGRTSAVLGATAALLLVSQVASAAAPTGRIVVNVSGLKGKNGALGCALFSSETGFPLKSKQHASKSARVPLTGSSTATCVFEDVAPGTYAVAVMHDVNDNQEADTNFLGIPTEGVGVSNNALPALSLPKFDACRFQVTATEPTTLAVSIRY